MAGMFAGKNMWPKVSAEQNPSRYMPMKLFWVVFSMNKIKQLFRMLFLAPDWYLVTMKHDCFVRFAYWNGWRWENRLGPLDDTIIARVLKPAQREGRI